MTALIETRGLTMRFGGILAVSELAFSVQPGELVGLIGPNGSGKTTTINMLTGHLVPAQGEIMVRGVRAHGQAASADTAVRPAALSLTMRTRVSTTTSAASAVSSSVIFVGVTPPMVPQLAPPRRVISLRPAGRLRPRRGAGSRRGGRRRSRSPASRRTPWWDPRTGSPAS